MVIANQDLTILFERKKKHSSDHSITSDFMVKKNNNNLLYSRVTCGEALACSDGLFGK